MSNKMKLQVWLIVLSTIAFAESPVKTIIPNEIEEGNHFGRSTVVSGNYIAISAPKNDNNGFSSGSVDIFHLVESEWEFVQTIVPSNPSAFDYFGHSLAMDDSVLVVGTPGDNENGHKSGSVYVFRNTINGWIEEARLLADDGNSNDNFGESVAVLGAQILVGAYRGSGLTSKTGCAYSFSYDGNEWAQDGKLFADDGVDYDHFGCSVALSGDWALVGAYKGNDKQGAAYLYYNDGLTLFRSNLGVGVSDRFTREFKDQKGNSLSSVRNVKFEKNKSKQNYSNEIIHEKEQESIPVNNSGQKSVNEEKQTRKSIDNEMVNNQSRTTTENRSWSQFQKLVPSDEVFGAFYGYSVDIKENTAVIGSYLANGNETQSGAVYIYELQNDSWVEEDKLFEPMGKKHDHYGIHVSIDINRLFVGVSHSEGNENNSGKILYYQRMGEDWNLIHTITEYEELPHNHFGLNFFVDGQMLIAGSPLYDGESHDEGVAFTFWPDINIIQENYNITVPRGTVFLDSLEISNSGMNSLMFDVESDADWLTVYPLTNSLESQSTEVIDFLVNATAIDTGQYYQTITISYPESNIPNLTINLEINVEGGLVGIDETLPFVYSLQQNYPNPFNPTTTIQFSVPDRSKTELKVFDIMGREVITLVNQTLEPGYHQIIWNGRNGFGQSIASGMYFTVMRSENFKAVKKMVLLK